MSDTKKICDRCGAPATGWVVCWYGCAHDQCDTCATRTAAEAREDDIEINRKQLIVCSECDGYGSYYTEWSDSAESDPELRAMVLYYPDPPDGTVEIQCSECKGKGRSEVAERR